MSGGSMMYVDAVCKGIDDIPSVDDNIRKHFKKDSIKKVFLALAKNWHY